MPSLRLAGRARWMRADLSSRTVAVVAAGAVALGGLVAAPSPSTAAGTATLESANGGDVEVVTLPADRRAKPRTVHLYGRTDDGHVVLSEATTPTAAGYSEQRLKVTAPDGSETDLTGPIESVVGNRLVREHTSTSVTSRSLGDEAWATQTVPAGWTLMDYTRDGLVVGEGVTGSFQRMGLVRWGATEVEEITGLPDGAVVSASSSLSWYDAVRDGSWTALRVKTPDIPDYESRILLANTETRRVWKVEDDNPDCSSRYVSITAINDGTLAWLQTSPTPGAVCTVRLPPADAPAGTRVGDAQRRTLTRLPATWRLDEYELLPVGDDVLISVREQSQHWGSDPGQPLLSIAPDGTSRTLAKAGARPIGADSGHALAVTGDARGASQVSDVDVSTGEIEQVRPIAPIAAAYTSIAVDGGDVVYSDDSAELGGARRRIVDLDTGTVGDSTLLGDRAPGPVAVGGGTAAWARSTWAQDPDNAAAVTSAGARFSGVYGDPRSADSRWVAANGGVLDTTTGDFRAGPSYIFQDGVSYKPGTKVPNGPKDVVVATDHVTRQADTIAVPGCTNVTEVQVAGSWMIARCTVGDTERWVVVDRTGTHDSWSFSVPWHTYLGNGFVVRRAAYTGQLDWMPLAGGTEDWRPLGVATIKDHHNTPSVAVSRGSVPTAAWYLGREARVARLPVETSPLPPHPTGITPPSVPTFDVIPSHNHIVVVFHRPPAAEQLTHYRVVAMAAAQPTNPASRQVDVLPTANFARLDPLANDRPYDVTVTATNIAGSTTSEPVRAVPMDAPPTPKDVRVHIDPLTGEATASWDYVPVDGWKLTSFSVGVFGEGNPWLTGFPPETRTVSLGVPAAQTSDVRVAAYFTRTPTSSSSGVGVSPEVTFPGPDVTAPRVAISGLSTMATTVTPSFSVTATDDRKLAASPVDVRYRTATRGRRLGSWVYPATWQGRGPGRVVSPRLAAGQTICLSARARDLGGNRSAWTSPRCTALALDDRALVRRGTATTLRGTGYYGGSATRLTRYSSYLTLSGLNANSGYLLATTCRRCGRIDVWVGGRRYGSIVLSRPTTRHRQLLPLPGAALKSGTMVLRLMRPYVENGVIDGVLLQAH